MEEIEEADAPDEYYKEFFQVIEFLLNDKEKMNHFSEVWSDYSVALREVIQGDAAVLHLKKKECILLIFLILKAAILVVTI